MRRVAARSGEWAQHFSNASCFFSSGHEWRASQRVFARCIYLLTYFHDVLYVTWCCRTCEATARRPRRAVRSSSFEFFEFFVSSNFPNTRRYEAPVIFSFELPLRMSSCLMAVGPVFRKKISQNGTWSISRHFFSKHGATCKVHTGAVM